MGQIRRGIEEETDRVERDLRNPPKSTPTPGITQLGLTEAQKFARRQEEQLRNSGTGAKV